MGSSTTFSRRSVLVIGASAAGAAALAGPFGSVAAAAAAPARANATPAVTGLRRDHWTSLVGRRVAVAGPSGTVRAVVVEVEDLRGAPAGDAGAFAVVLRTDRGQAGIAGLNPVTIPGRGVATLLVSAVDRGAKLRLFQIVVNNPAH